MIFLATFGEFCYFISVGKHLNILTYFITTNYFYSIKLLNDVTDRMIHRYPYKMDDITIETDKCNISETVYSLKIYLGC